MNRAKEIATSIIFCAVQIVFSVFAGDKTFIVIVGAIFLSIPSALEIYLGVSYLTQRKRFLSGTGRTGISVSCKRRNMESSDPTRNKKFILTAESNGELFNIPTNKRIKKNTEVLFDAEEEDAPVLAKDVHTKMDAFSKIGFAVAWSVFIVLLLYAISQM